MIQNNKKVALAKLSKLNLEGGASLLEQSGYQLIGQHGYPQQQKSEDLKIYYYSEHQYQMWDNQANPVDHKLHTAVYESINDYINRESPLSESWSDLVQ